MPLVPESHGDRCRPEAEPARERVHLHEVRNERGKEVKKKLLWKVARMVEQIAILTEELADAIQHKAPTGVLIGLREAVRSLDDATFYLDELRARKK